MRALRTTLGVVGELAITAGVLLLLFVVWQLGFVTIVDGRQQAGTVSALEQNFGAPKPGGQGPAPGATSAAAPVSAPPVDQAALKNGEAFAILRIPRLGGPGWAKPVLQGVGLDVLANGLGHYPGTQMPGEVGNVAIAGHRAGHGSPLIDIDAIRAGDVAVIETREAYFVYRVARYEIVPPTKVDVLAPVPESPGAAPTERWLTLTTCDPRYGSTNRYIVFAKLAQKIPRAQGLPPDLLADPARKA